MDQIPDAFVLMEVIDKSVDRAIERTTALFHAEHNALSQTLAGIQDQLAQLNKTVYHGNGSPPLVKQQHATPCDTCQQLQIDVERLQQDFNDYKAAPPIEGGDFVKQEAAAAGINNQAVINYKVQLMWAILGMVGWVLVQAAFEWISSLLGHPGVHLIK